ncbi:fasciclin domain-containing protein [Sphingobacterium sp. SGR-19]|uniref:fasciclin domain-containing protein n=1 Tax=Sphingobacterium sp. SGR-19 TaxID=2710886 RepID=UPI0013EB5669|nr:fasciclin domain-containing protein [Sphingobacterium sp. SGR-19]NGM64112.1 hypothetical protein [Sphingobacterium sp. SGR-19]
MRLFFLLCCIGIFLGACDDEYYNDGGVLDSDVGVFNGTTMGYLESQPAMFDTLTTLIKLNGLEAEVNRAGSTFFAPQNYSIYNFLILRYPDAQNRPKRLEDIPASEMAEIAAGIRNYIIPDKQIRREDLSTVYTFSSTLGGRKARFNLVKEDYLGNVNMGAASVVFSINMSASGMPERYQSAKVIRADVKTTDGWVHVLVSDTHIFGFN